MVSLSSSLLDCSDNDDGEHEHQEHAGDYSTRMDELFADQNEGDEEGSPSHSPRSERIEVTRATYREQLRDVLGSEPSGEYDDTDDMDHSLPHENAFSDDEHPTQSISDSYRPVSPCTLTDIVHPDVLNASHAPGNSCQTC
jgi:vacuolar protein sorting-associated protein 8